MVVSSYSFADINDAKADAIASTNNALITTIANYYTKEEIDEIVNFYDSNNDGIVNAADYAYDSPGGSGGDPNRITNQDIDIITNKI